MKTDIKIHPQKYRKITAIWCASDTKLKSTDDDGGIYVIVSYTHDNVKKFVLIDKTCMPNPEGWWIDDKGRLTTDKDKSWPISHFDCLFPQLQTFASNIVDAKRQVRRYMITRDTPVKGDISYPRKYGDLWPNTNLKKQINREIYIK